MGKLRRRNTWLLYSSVVVLLAACSQTGNNDASISNNQAVSMSTESVISSESQESSETTVASSSQSKSSDQVVSSDQSDDEQNSAAVETYFPKIKGYAAKFEGTGNEYAPFSRTYDFIDDDYIQMRSNNGGTTVAEIVEVTEDAATIVYSQPESYAYAKVDLEDVSMDDQTPYVVLAGPIELGHSWDSGRGTTREITGINVQMSTMHGLYDTIEVTEDTGNFINKEYYAADIGLVYTSSESTDPEAPYTVIQDLASLSKEGWTEPILAYYPVGMDDYEKTETSVSMTTNDEMADILTNLFQTTGQEPLMDVGMAINDLDIKRDQNTYESTLYVEFSEEIKNLASDEMGMQKLNAIMATLKNYYGVSTIIPTIDDEPMYIEGLVKLNEGAAFEVPGSVTDGASLVES